MTPNANATRSAIRSRVPKRFIARRHLDEKGINQLEKEVEAELQIAVDKALEAFRPCPKA